VRDPAVAREKVAREEKAKAFAVEAHVAVGVAGKMDGLQPVPDIEEVAFVEWAIRDEWAVGKNWSADGFQEPGDVGPTAILGMAGVVVGIEARRSNPGAGFARNGGDVEDVVEMPVSDDDSADRLAFPSASVEGASQKIASSDETGVEEI
jgi:hypothetical protein